MTVLGTPEAAVAILRAREADSFLLMRRSEHPHDPWSGHWSFPGGRRDPDDADLLQTALRELHEECSIRLSPEDLQIPLAPVVARRRTPPFMVVAPFVFSVESELPTVLDPEEAVESAWIATRYWNDPAQHLLRRVPGMPEHWLFPAVDLNGVPVWGFTYRLVMDWLGLLPTHSPGQSAAMPAAEQALQYLASRGLTITQEWKASEAQASTTAQLQPRATAAVEGLIPVEQALAEFSKPGATFPTVSAIEVQPNYVRVVGLEFEEYVINAR